MKIYRYFFALLEKKGYCYFESQQPTCFALLCSKNRDLIELGEKGIIPEY